MSGQITRAQKLEIGYFAQHQLDELNADEGAYGHLRRLMPDAPEAKVRAHAGAVGFPQALADTPSSQLSGGEKARLLLGLATFRGPHLVVLDEPTNHLDIDSRAALIEAINGFSGAVILVSHDRYLLDACAERLWLVAGGTVAPFDGDLDDYRRLVLAKSDDGTNGRRTADARPSRSDERRAAAEKRAELAPLKRRIAGVEAEMAKLMGRMSEIDTALADPTLYDRDPARVAVLAKERAEAAAALHTAEEQWLTLSANYDSASS